MTHAGASGRGGERMLWKLEGGRVHLIPALHFLSREDYPTRREYSKAFNRSDVIVLESDWWSPQARPAAAKPEESISAAGEQFCAQVEATFSALGLGTGGLATQSPHDAMFTIGSALCVQEGCSFDFGLDAHFRNRALANGKRVSFLENPSATSDVLNGVPFGERLAALQRQIKTLGLFRERFRWALTAWRSSDVETLIAATSLAESESPAVMGPLISGRSVTWLPEILRIHASGERVAICVGVFHCFGERGLPALLTKAGIGCTYQSHRVGSGRLP